MSNELPTHNQPLVSVVMPVYNAGTFLVQAIESVLGQTYQNFELIAVDDRSTDNSWGILKSYAKKDSRIRVFRNHRNLKSARTASIAMEKARGDFIARLDADDIALPQRLEKQLSYLLEHTETVGVGGQCLLIDNENNLIGEKHFLPTFDEIYRQSFIFCPAQQGMMMFARHRLPKDFQLYNYKMSPVEDMEMLFKLYQYGKVENMKDYFLLYRFHEDNNSFKNLRKSFYLTLLARIRSIRHFGYKPTVLGLLATFAQIVVVTLLPQKATFALYKKMKLITPQKSSLAIASGVLEF